MTTIDKTYNSYYIYHYQSAPAVPKDALRLSRRLWDNNGLRYEPSRRHEAIWIEYRIPVERQVLLVSGGECLDSSKKVCNYQAGIDTNPIFLFDKLQIETSSPNASGQINTNQIHVNYGSNDNLIDMDNVKDQIEGCLSLPPTYVTVVSRCQLAQQLYEMGRDISRKCEQLTNDQHLQHQGWAAVVANLEDVIICFRKRIDHFQHAYSTLGQDKEHQLELLNGFENALKALGKVDVVPCLVNKLEMTLYEWVEAKDRASPLREYAAGCRKALDSLDSNVIDSLEKEAMSVVEKGSQTSMKEIKGLEERLFGLEQLLNEARKLVMEQYDLLQAFIQNQNRASDLKDSSILPDLCQSHQHQLLVMQKNHQQLDDIRRRCQKAKDELSVNLNSRLKWVVYVQKSLQDASNKLTMYIEKLKRIKLQSEILEQIHAAPHIYSQAVLEVYRRRQFANTFLEWASELSTKMDRIYKAELQKRKEFGVQFDGHFLCDLFCGLNELPKPFANQSPEPFDNNLPEIVAEDVEKLKLQFSWMKETDEEMSLDLPSSTRSEDSTKSTLEMENGQLKLDIENYQFELKAKDDLMTKLLAGKERELEAAQVHLQSKETQILSGEIANAKKSNEIATLKEMLEYAESNLLKLAEQGKSQLEIEQGKTQAALSEVKDVYEKEMKDLEEQLTRQKDEAVREIKEKCKAEIEGLKSRFKYMSSIEQKSPVDTFDVHKSFDGHSSFDRVKSEELLTELNRVVDSIHKSLPEGLSPYSIRRILKKLENPSPIRSRNVSEGCQRSSGETEEDQSPTGCNRSVYGLDTSAIEATTMVTEDAHDLSELFMPTQRIVNTASKLVHSRRVTIQGCRTNDYVFIYWNEKLSSYVLYLNAKNVHFLHTESLKAIQLSSPESLGEGFIGCVLEKEFCVARRDSPKELTSDKILQFTLFPFYLMTTTKSLFATVLPLANLMVQHLCHELFCHSQPHNRYHVPEGFHFYRVKVTLAETLNISSLLIS